MTLYIPNIEHKSDLLIPFVKNMHKLGYTITSPVPKKGNHIDISPCTKKVRVRYEMTHSGFNIIDFLEDRPLNGFIRQPYIKQGSWVKAYGTPLKYSSNFTPGDIYKLHKDFSEFSAFFTVFDDNNNCANGWEYGWAIGINAVTIPDEHMEEKMTILAKKKGLVGGAKVLKHNGSKERLPMGEKYKFSLEKAALYHGKKELYREGRWIKALD